MSRMSAGTAPASTDQDVGPRLRVERSNRGISLRQLAKSVGISPSALSQIETGRSKPSVKTLYALVSELGLSLDELFSSEQHGPVPAPRAGDRRTATADAATPAPAMQTADERKSLTLDSGVIWERLTPTSEPDVDFLHVIYEVGGASSRADTFLRHSGREYGLVLEGDLRVTVGFDEYELGPGDSIAFDSSRPHRLENTGDIPVKAIWFAMGRHSSDPRRDGLNDD